LLQAAASSHTMSSQVKLAPEKTASGPDQHSFSSPVAFFQPDLELDAELEYRDSLDNGFISPASPLCQLSPTSPVMLKWQRQRRSTLLSRILFCFGRKGGYGHSSWYRSLINACIFAMLSAVSLIVFLAATKVFGAPIGNHSSLVGQNLSSPNGKWTLNGFKTFVAFGDSHTDEGRAIYFETHDWNAPPIGWNQPVVCQITFQRSI
jgi:hypothetical protein